ncbi:NADH-quinone oxidoreductase subunit N [Novimethylophilus kurashikiensis]|uniref:NADH-quinone oxidoreductase subunit N n=1 Tax=Novimethylophilus kurashikiensis TaxID=1825523 RepID=A0A2R5F7M9_9PROT|nr:NADH-quinone oxidoreductase subunit NuoN [Novimethylophilus kurashikiensis]GBG14045.1 NADH-quinone oxidoreductase subunit N [Novimethylophilus kurashikiensis]
MNPIFNDIYAALPEVFVLTMAMVILLGDLFIQERYRFVTYVMAQVTLLGAAMITIATHTSAVGYAFNGLFVDDPLSDLLKLMTYLAVSVVLVYSRGYITARGMYRGEFYVLVLMAMLGMMVMISGQNLLTIYMGLELLSLCLYSLVALDRDNARATEAAMKYFVLGALASGMLLYGMSMLYGMSGSLDVSQISNAILNGSPDHAVLILGLVFVVAGIAFKFGAAPFQMWIPDVYHGAPTSMTLFVGSAPKLAAYAMTIRLLVQGLQNMVHDWQGMLIIMAVLSIIIGNITAIAQTNLKRMLAYSTISHVGFLLFGFFSGTLNGFIASMFYVASYVLMTLGGFGIILLLSRKGFEAENLDDLKGLNNRSPWYAFLMMLLMFSMAGVPPTIGFYAKFAVLQAALQAGYVWLTVFAVLLAVTGAFYYLRIVKLMYFDEAEDHHAIRTSPDMALVLGVNGLAMLVLGIFPQRLMELCAYAVLHSVQ